MKRSGRHIPKNCMVKDGLKRTGVFPDLKWEYKGQTFDTLAQAYTLYVKLNSGE